MDFVAKQDVMVVAFTGIEKSIVRSPMDELMDRQNI